MDLNFYLFASCMSIYAILAVWIAVFKPNVNNVVLAGCCLVTSLWAATQAAYPVPSLTGIRACIDLARMLAWYGYIYYLVRRSESLSVGQARTFGAIGVLVGGIGLAAAAMPLDIGDVGTSLLSVPIAVRLTLAVCELLLIENLYLNMPEQSRWHIAIPCILLGGLACFDILVVADTVLFHRQSVQLEGARAIAMVMVAPLLLIAASRGQRWRAQVRLSRSAAFHSATLVLSGSVLLALALAGEVLRRLSDRWGWLAEVSLVFAGCIGLLLFLSSRSAQSVLHRVIVYHFFAGRYDYRVEWLKIIDILSGTGSDERTALHTRAIRAVADIVDSPNGVLYLSDGGNGAFSWSGSWNMPSAGALSGDDPVVTATRGGEWVVDLSRLPPPQPASALQALGRVWLAIPLLHATGMIGLVMVGPPRVPLKLDQETFDLLRIVGREVATHIVEQRTAEVMLQTRHLHDYGKRFAFVAHDVKNVSSQLALLLRNAEHHISNPEFQRDMLETVKASVQKISGLLKRLEDPAPDAAPSAVTPVPRLEVLVATYQRVRKATISLEHDGSTGKVAMAPGAFDTAVTHLLNNAVEASGGQPVQLRVEHEAKQVLIDIVDHGCGMSADFIRDHLFAPFATQKEGGSGIGAFQARELVREAGGEVTVSSEVGRGTTMRIILARADQPARGSGEHAAMSEAGV